jgi:two-component system, LytTR family, sensor kinase
MIRSALPEAIFRILANRTALHTLFWTFLYTTLVLLETGDLSFAAKALHTGVFLSFCAATTYVHFFLLGAFLNRRRYVMYAGGLVVTLGLLGSLFSWVTTFLSESRGSLPGAIFSLTFFMGFTTALHYARAGVRQRMQLQEIIAKQLQTELALLQAQINPHFLFNTLNNLYAMALRQKDPSTAQGIARLAHLMRYVIYESDVDRIELGKEAEQIRSFLELQKLRFSEGDNIRIEFVTEGDLEKSVIAPMLLLPFVENAFKHGIRLSSASHVSMRLTANDAAIRFAIENSVHATAESRADSESALGLRNVKRRLELLYPGTHSLSIREGEGVYRVELDLGSERPK